MEAFFNTMSVPAKFLLAFIVVLAVLGIGGYLMRRLTGGTLSIAGPRGRQPRLAVIDAASVDGRRRLVLVRRDNVEHLLLIGGPTDIVVEPNIDKAAVAASAAVPASPTLRDIAASPAFDAVPRPSPSYEAAAREAIPPISREPISREPLPRAAAYEPSRAATYEPAPRAAATYEPAPRPASYEPVPRQAAAFEPTLHPAAVIEETHWPTAEPAAPAEPSHAAWPAPEPIAAAPVEPPYAPPHVSPHASWPTPEPLAPAPVEVAIIEPAIIEPTWPEPVAATQVEPVAPHVAWPVPEPIAPAPVEPPRQLREAAAWPFDEDAVAPPLMPTPVEPEPVIPPPPPPPAFEPVFETRRMPTAPPLPPRNGQTDASNLSEMAHRLEAALRRPIRPVERVVPPPASYVAIEMPEPAPPPAPPAPPAPSAPPPELSVVPAAAPEPIAPPAAPAPQPIPSPRPAPVFTSIEEEMASLLGRSPGRP